MSEASSNRAVRKALLQAHAEIERIEVAQRVAQVREAVSPRSLLHNVLPFSFGGSHSGHRSGSSLAHLASQAGDIYQKYPMIWSTLASLFIGRGRATRIVKILGIALAVRKAVQVSRKSRSAS